MSTYQRLLAALLLVSATAAAEPLTVTHQGRLFDGSDAPVNDASIAMVFRLYNVGPPGDTAERLVWQSTSCQVPVRSGFYTTVLGKDCTGATALSTDHFPGDEARFLEVEVNGVKLLPRLPLTASPVAMVARNAQRIGGLDLDALDKRYAPAAPAQGGAYVQLNPASAQAGGINVTGTVTAAAFSGAFSGTATGSFSGNGAALTNLAASALATGTLPSARLAGEYGEALTLSSAQNRFTGDGAGLTGLDASALAKGTVPDGRLSGTYGQPLTLSNAGNRFTGDGAGLANVDAAKLGGQTLSALDQRYLRAGASGTTTFTSSVKLGDDTASCTSANAGSIKWDGAHFAGCDGTQWKRLDRDPPPAIAGLAPAAGSTFGGGVVTITGSGFLLGAQVFVDTVAATNVQVLSSTQLKCTVPAGTAGPRDVRVVNPDGQTGTAIGGFTYMQGVFGYTGTDQTFTVPAGVTSITVKLWGGGGGGGRTPNVHGGPGGYATGTLAVSPGQTYLVVVGGGGKRQGAASGAGAGGGYSGIFLGSGGQAAAKLIAGGGGGGGYYESSGGGSMGGYGGGSNAGDGSATDGSYYASRGLGGTTTGGGAGGCYSGGFCGTSGSALQGGAGGCYGGYSPIAGTYGGGGGTCGGTYDAGGGGGGYFGGGGGSNNAPLGGGGGSGYIGSGVTNGLLSGTPSLPPNMNDPHYATGIALGGYTTNPQPDGGAGRVILLF